MYHVHHVNKYVNYAGSWTTFFMAFFCASFARVLVPSPAGGAEILLVHRYPPPRFHFTANFCLRVRVCLLCRRCREFSRLPQLELPAPLAGGNGEFPR